MSLEDAFSAHEDAHRAAVMQDTWGHLAPAENRTYSGYIVFAIGSCADDRYPMKVDYAFKDLDGGPFLYDAIGELLDELFDAGKVKAGNIYRWDGTFRNYRFKGKIKRLAKR